MLSDAMQTLAGRDADMTAEATGATSQRRVASCPVRERPRISWMRGDAPPRISFGRLRSRALGQAPPHRRREPGMIYAGVDIAKTDHVIGAVDERGAEMCPPMPFKNTEAGLERAVAWLEGLAGSPSDVVVGMEATGHYWMACYSFLVARGYSVAVINPMQVKAVRKLKGLDKVKNDRVDAGLIAEALRIGQYDETRLATDEMASLRSLSRYLQSLRGMVAELKTQCICLMDAHFPEYAGIFSDMFGAGSRAVLSKSPLPFELARRRADSLARDIAEASRRGGKSSGYAAKIKAAAKSSIGVRLGQEAASFQVKSLIRQIEFADSECAGVEARLRSLLDEVEPLVLTIPGVSYVTGAQIVSEIGDVSRFRNAPALVSYAGLNSSVSQSGQFDSGGGPITKHGSPYLRRALWLAANRARQYDPGAARLLRQEARRGQAPSRGRHGRGEEAVPHRVRGDARPGPVRPGEGIGQSKPKGIGGGPAACFAMPGKHSIFGSQAATFGQLTVLENLRFSP